MELGYFYSPRLSLAGIQEGARLDQRWVDGRRQVGMNISIITMQL